MKELIETANKLWAVVRGFQRMPGWKDKTNEERISELQSRGFSDFITKFSIPVRYMVAYGEFSEKAFEQYLKRIDIKGYKSQEEWTERQADYVKLLWRQYNPHGNNEEAKQVWQTAKRNLMNEMDNFKKDYEEAKRVAEQKNEEILNFKRAQLLELYKSDPKVRDMINGIVTSEPHSRATG